MYSHPRASTAATILLESLPASATRHTRRPPKRRCNRSATRSRVVTSVVLPGHISLHTEPPSPSMTIPSTLCLQSLRRSLLLAYWPSVSPPSPVKNSEVVSKNTRSRSVNRSRHRANSASSMRSLVRRGEGGVGLGFTERLAEPAHRAVQMLEFKRFGGVDGLVAAPLKGASVGARDHHTVQHGPEHRAFDIEVMVAGGEQLAHHRLAGGGHATGVRRSVPGRSRRRWRRANRVHRRSALRGP